MYSMQDKPDQPPMAAQPTSSTIWAKQQSSPYWPSRLLCAAEVKAIEKYKPGKSKGRSTEYAGVFFYGNRQMGWVNAGLLTAFEDKDFMVRVNDKKMNSDVQYQRGVIEAARLLRAIDLPVTNMLAALDIDDANMLNASEKCEICSGTDDSGHLVRCTMEGCPTMLHAHCMDPPRATGPWEKSWVCDRCVTKLGQEKQRKAVAEAKQKFLANGHESCPTHILLDNVAANQEAQAVEGGHIQTSITAAYKELLGPASKLQDAIANLKSSEPKAMPPSKAIKGAVSTMTSLEKFISQLYPSSASSSSKMTSSPTSASPSQTQDSVQLKMDMDSSAELLDEDSEDICSVCQLSSGSVLICEFPNCSRVYHQACVCKTVSDPLGAEHPRGGDDEAWFCPTHFCTMCSRLEDPGIPLASTNPPSYLLSNRALQMVAVQKCETCPFSICQRCLEELDGDGLPWCDNGGLFGPKRRAKHVCRNCRSNNPQLRFSRLLERCWARMSTTRLAIPFLRPCLPLALAQTNSDRPFPDLLAILEKIRRCEYKSVADFQQDLADFQAGSEQVLNREGSTGPDAPLASPAQILLETLHTLIEAAESFLDRHASSFAYLQYRCAQQDSSTANTAIVKADRVGVRYSQTESDLSDEEEIVASTSRSSSELDMVARGFWRKECENETLVRNQAYQIVAHTLSEWAEFVSEGPKLPRDVHADEAVTDRNAVRRMLSDSLPVEDAVDQEMAAQMMLALRQDRAGGGDWRRSSSQLQAMLDDLDQATSHMIRVQQELRRSVTTMQREVLNTSAGTITIGEAHVLHELQLANQSLRVRLRRKDTAINLLKDTIRMLQAPAEQRAQITALLAERDRLKRENERLQKESLVAPAQVIADGYPRSDGDSPTLATDRKHGSGQQTYVLRQTTVPSNTVNQQEDRPDHTQHTTSTESLKRKAGVTDGMPEAQRLRVEGVF